MINGFILVSVLCLKMAKRDVMVAGVPGEKIGCNSEIHEVYKTREACEADNEKRTETLEISRANQVKKFIIMPGSACVEVNKIVGSEVQWKP